MKVESVMLGYQLATTIFGGGRTNAQGAKKMGKQISKKILHRYWSREGGIVFALLKGYPEPHLRRE